MKTSLRNVLIALGFIVVGGLVGWKLSRARTVDASSLWTFIRILALLFLANGLYGLFSGRVFGRSWKKYWGGWCYRQEEPFYYWSYTLGHLAVGAFLLLVGR